MTAAVAYVVSLFLHPYFCEVTYFFRQIRLHSFHSTARAVEHGNRLHTIVPIRNQPPEGCVLLADRHHGLTEGVHGILATMFETVVMVTDERSLIETARHLLPAMVVADLSLVPGKGLNWLLTLKNLVPSAKLIILSVHDEPSVCARILELGADAFVLKRDLGTELAQAVDATRAGERYVPPEFQRHPDEPRHRTDMPGGYEH